MPAAISLTQVQIFSALRTVLLGFLPAGFECVRGQINRVSEPHAKDFAVLWPIMRTRLSTNRDTCTDGQPVGSRAALTPTQVTVQCDVHGPNAAENAQCIATLMRDEYATIAFSRTGIDCQPLYASDPMQIPFDNAEQQLEQRWTVDVNLQANIVVTVPQQFADQLTVTPISVDAAYPLINEADVS